MPKYLHTQAISAAIVDLMNEAKERLYLISPYLKLSDTLKDKFRDKDAEGVVTNVIFGKQSLTPDEMTFLRSLKNVKLFFSRNLHAKCYLNEQRMIIASMNLYEFSQQTNREMGVMVEVANEADKAVYSDAWKDIQSIERNAENFAISSPPASAKDTKDHDVAATESLVAKYVRKYSSKSQLQELDEDDEDDEDDEGHCIRCDDEIDADPSRPYCLACYREWKAEGADERDKEEVCHFCGDEHGATMAKPVCYGCYKANRELF